MTDHPAKLAANCCDRKVVRVSGHQLTSTCDKGIEHQYEVDPDAKLTYNGKASKLSGLKADMSVRITTCRDNVNKVIALDSGDHIPAMATRRLGTSSSSRRPTDPPSV